MKLCAGPSLPLWKGQRGYGSVNLPQTLSPPLRSWVDTLSCNSSREKTQKILSGHTKHYATGGWKPKVIHNPFQQRGPLDWWSDDKVLVTAFMRGLRPGEFLFSFYKNDPKAMVEVLYKAMKYMNAEDAMIARGDGPRKRQRQDDLRLDKSRKVAQTNEWKENKRSKSLSGRTVNFTPLNTPLDKVLMQIRDDMTLTWPNKLKGDPGERP